MKTALDFLRDPKYGLVKEVRTAQLKCAGIVEDTIKTGGVCTIEAGTGTGKSFAYLLPSIFSYKRVVVCTAKKSLQDQLIQKDIPAIEKAIGRRIKVTAVKGKSNYACEHWMNTHHLKDAAYSTWLKSSPYGDKSEYRLKLPTWAHTATAESCISKACPKYNSCGYTKLKGDIEKSDVVITNHALVGFDFLYGRGKYFGGNYSVLVVDEGHLFASGLRNAFTKSVVENSVDNILAELRHTGFMFNNAVDLVRDWQNMFRSMQKKNDMTWELIVPVFNESMAKNVLSSMSALQGELVSSLSSYGIVNLSNENFWTGAKEILSKLMPDEASDLVRLIFAHSKLDTIKMGLGGLQGLPEREIPEGASLEEIDRIKKSNQSIIDNTVVYGKLDNDKLAAYASPIHLGPRVGHILKEIGSVIITSATLAVDGKFDHLRDELGVTPLHEAVFPSVFDYKKQALLYVPQKVPEPRRGSVEYPLFLDRITEETIKLIEASNGNTLVLFTANDEMTEVTKRMEPKLTQTVFVQGRDGQAPEALRKYMNTNNSVLCGLKSYFEGLDISGDKLRLVVITKLPFPQDKDPILQARKKLYGDNSFTKVQYADMLTDLRQAAGRLIRTQYDRGVVAILDSRIWTKRYGGQILSALPFINRSSDQSLTCKYLKALAEKSTNGVSNTTNELR